MIWFGLKWKDLKWNDTIWFGLKWCGYDMMRYDTIRFDMIWNDMIMMLWYDPYASHIPDTAFGKKLLYPGHAVIHPVHPWLQAIKSWTRHRWTE